MTAAEFGRQAASNALELIFPGRCLVCGRALYDNAEPFYPVCRSCLAVLVPIRAPRCRQCGRTLISESDVCTVCRKRDYHFQSHRSLFEYQGAVKEILFQYKFRGRSRLARVIADCLGQELNKTYPGLPIVPVPSRAGRSSAMGLEHLELICRHLHRRHKLRICRCLRRMGSVPQKTLDFDSRLKNVMGNIRIIGSRGLGLDVPEIVLLDDVFTTGATVDECARVLLADARKVHVLTFAQD